ncbi:MAG: hypothetical protein K1X79_04875 [Oligoflexia bacterium]|nr:hypothetical protein [Oligoflexia bacterium]
MRNRLLVAAVSMVALSVSVGCSVPPAVKEAQEHEVTCADCRAACQQLPSSPKVYSLSAIQAANDFVKACEAIIRLDPNCKLPKECIDEVEEQKRDAQKQLDGIYSGDADITILDSDF